MPYLLHKNFGYRAVLVGTRLDKNYPYLEQLRGLELDFLPEDTEQTRIAYLDAHVADIDLLMLYGAYPAYMSIAAHYKKIRPDGKIYLAADMNIGWADRIPHEKPAYKNFIQSCDVIAVSCRAVQKHLSAKWSVPVDLIRNGWYNLFDVKIGGVPKENIILTVGRIGAAQKQSHVLLEAFAKVADDLPDWNLRLVGGVEEDFLPHVEKFFAENPNLRGRVTFTGLIEDKRTLTDEYNRAKIFCLTSKTEGFPNAAAEALTCGDFMITSAIDAADDINDAGSCGKVFPIGDVDALAKIFRETCRDDKLIRDGGQRAAAYAREQFDAEKIVARLNYLLYGGDDT